VVVFEPGWSTRSPGSRKNRNRAMHPLFPHPWSRTTRRPWQPGAVSTTDLCPYRRGRSAFPRTWPRFPWFPARAGRRLGASGATPLLGRALRRAAVPPVRSTSGVPGPLGNRHPRALDKGGKGWPAPASASPWTCALEGQRAGAVADLRPRASASSVTVRVDGAPPTAVSPGQPALDGLRA